MKALKNTGNAVVSNWFMGHWFTNGMMIISIATVDGVNKYAESFA